MFSCHSGTQADRTASLSYMAIKCPTPEVAHVLLAQSLLARTNHKSPPNNKGVGECDDTMCPENKEQEIFGKTSHKVPQGKSEGEMR